VSRTWTALATTFLLFLTAFGVYLGRFLRWNSWDIISDPTALLLDVLDRLVHPLLHIETWGVTLLYGLFLNFVYWSFKMMGGRA